MRLHGVPRMIVSDRDCWVTSRFWQQMYKVLDRRLHFFSTIYHSQLDGQSDRLIQTLEAMLIACVLG